MSHIPSHTACTIVRVESYHGPNAGREIINENFECLNQVVGELQTASATGATIVSASTNIVLTTGFTNGNIPVYTVGVTDNPIFASLSANSISATTLSSQTINLASTSIAQIIMQPVNVAAPPDGSMWFTTSGGTTVLNYQVSGVTKSVELT